MSVRIVKVGPHPSNGHTVYAVEADHFDELTPVFDIINQNDVITNPSIRFLLTYQICRFQYISPDADDDLLDRISLILKLTL